MPRSILSVAVFVLLPILSNALFKGNPFCVKGGVYCDTCRVGYETYASKKLAGAMVELVCKKSDGSDTITYRQKCSTDSKGEYQMFVPYDAGDEICDMILLHSPDGTCATPDAGRDRARVCLTRNNGIASDVRFANNLGYVQDVPLAQCPQILKQYQETDIIV